MKEDKGWVKLYRSIRDHWVYEDRLLYFIWLDLIMRANHKERKIVVKGKLIVLHPGQFWTSIRRLAVEWGLDKDTVSKKLKILQSDDMIYVDSRPRYGTMITVRNYGLYQGFSGPDSDNESDNNSDNKSDKESDNVQFNNRTKNRHKQELKNYKNDKELKNNGLPPDHPDYFEEV